MKDSAALILLHSPSSNIVKKPLLSWHVLD